jgi:hypothetical protein
MHTQGVLDTGPAALERRSWRIALAACAALALAGAWVVGPFRLPGALEGVCAVEAMVGCALFAYMIAMALPFVPGIEIGLGLMLLLGEEGVLLVYLATQFSLMSSYLAGRLLPARLVAAAFRWLGMERARRLVDELQSIPLTGGLAHFAERAPSRWLRALARHRGVALVALLNLPGNAVIGGAGGIGMIAGMSRAYAFPRYALLVAVATAPVPLFLLLGGAP